MRNSIVITDYGFPDISQEKSIFRDLDYDVIAGQCSSEDEVIKIAKTADALLVQWAPITRKVIDHLERCKIIVRYGIGTDNIDLEAAKEKGIPVCNIPDYCIQEVADHSIALAIALCRQLRTTDILVRKGTWKITPPMVLPPFREMVFATLGYGRIARDVLRKASALGFRVATYDPFVSAEEIEENKVKPMSQEQLLEKADILSLHLPLTNNTYHIINRKALELMKSKAILINTARGGLVDTKALAVALTNKEIGAAGLDVFETEPLPVDHPLMHCENAILTSHTAWYSSSSVSVLQKMAAEEVVRGLSGQTLNNKIN